MLNELLPFAYRRCQAVGVENQIKLYRAFFQTLTDLTKNEDLSAVVGKSVTDAFSVWLDELQVS